MLTRFGSASFVWKEVHCVLVPPNHTYSVKEYLEWRGWSMGFLNRVKGTLDAATRKSQDVLEINKLNQQIKKLEEDVKELYVRIGEQVYRDPGLVKRETKIQIDSCVHTLERLHRQIQETKQKTLILKDLIECTTCEKVMSVNIKYCPECGHYMADAVQKILKSLITEEQHKTDH